MGLVGRQALRRPLQACLRALQPIRRRDRLLHAVREQRDLFLQGRRAGSARRQSCQGSAERRDA
eukprot:8049471-Lingulodinium_polyedra.AAC.1